MFKMDDIVPVARLCNYLSSLSMYTSRICITFSAASKCEVYHHSIACFSKCGRNQLKAVPCFPSCQSVSWKEALGEGSIFCNTPQTAYFCHLGRNTSAKVNEPIAPGQHESRRVMHKPPPNPLTPFP